MLLVEYKYSPSGCGKIRSTRKLQKPLMKVGIGNEASKLFAIRIAVFLFFGQHENRSHGLRTTIKTTVEFFRLTSNSNALQPFHPVKAADFYCTRSTMVC